MSEEHLAGPAQSSAGPWTGPQQVLTRKGQLALARDGKTQGTVKEDS